VDHCYGITETYHYIAVAEKFLHVPCVSSPFIRFWHITNEKRKKLATS
jgi:hypothetical protein